MVLIWKKNGLRSVFKHLCHFNIPNNRKGLDTAFSLVFRGVFKQDILGKLKIMGPVNKNCCFPKFIVRERRKISSVRCELPVDENELWPEEGREGNGRRGLDPNPGSATLLAVGTGGSYLT